MERDSQQFIGQSSAFLDAVDPAAILETVRTGASGIGRGDRIMKI